MKETKHAAKNSNSTAKPQKQQATASRPGIQAKLQIGQPGDKYEREADSIADRVVASGPMSHPTPSPLGIQRKCASCDQEEKLQRKPLVSEISPLQSRGIQRNQEQNIYGKGNFYRGGYTFCSDPNKWHEEKSACEHTPNEYKWNPDGTSIHVLDVCKDGNTKIKLPKVNDLHKVGPCDISEDDKPSVIQAKANRSSNPTVSSSLETQLSNSKGGGSPLPDGVRSEMEGKIGTDFSQVRLHTNSSAVQMSKEIGAQAFTHGKDVYFNSGKFSPNTSEGKHLLAHELVHTVQQEGIRPKRYVINSSNRNMLNRKKSTITSADRKRSMADRTRFLNLGERFLIGLLGRTFEIVVTMRIGRPLVHEYSDDHMTTLDVPGNSAVYMKVRETTRSIFYSNDETRLRIKDSKISLIKLLNLLYGRSALECFITCMVIGADEKTKAQKVRKGVKTFNTLVGVGITGELMTFRVVPETKVGKKIAKKVVGLIGKKAVRAIPYFGLALTLYDVLECTASCQKPTPKKRRRFNFVNGVRG